MTSNYDAYISYSHKDASFARWLHRGIETYRVPQQLVSSGRPMRVFRDRVELPSSTDLGLAIEDALRRSDALIVVCSPASVQSRWVNEEIRRFKMLGRQDRVFAIILEGEPPDCFPPALRQEVLADGEIIDVTAELAAADARGHADGKRNARLKLIAGMLNVGFDELYHRDLHRKQQRMAAIVAASLGMTVLTLGLALFAIDARNDAERRRAQAEELVAFMIGDLRPQLESLGRLDILDQIGDKSMDFYAALESDDESDELLTTRAQALRQIGRVRVSQGRLADAATSFQQSHDLALQISNRNPERNDYRFEVGQSHYWKGFVQYRWSNMGAATRNFEAYREVAEHLLDREPDNRAYRMELAYAHSNLGTIAVETREIEVALAHFTAAVAINEALLTSTPDEPVLILDLAGGYSWLGALAADEGKIRAAISWYRREMAIRELLTKDDGSMSQLAFLAVSNQLLGFQLFLAGDNLEAKSRLQQSLELAEQLVQHDPENNDWRRTLHTAHYTLARVHLSEANPIAANNSIEHAARGLGELSRADPSNVRGLRDYGTALLFRARAWLNLNEVDAAVQATNRALRIAEELKTKAAASADSLWLSGALALTEGDIASEYGNASEASARWQFAIDTLTSRAEQTKDPVVLSTLLEAVCRTGDLKEAERVRKVLDGLGYGGTSAMARAVVRETQSQ